MKSKHVIEQTGEEQLLRKARAGNKDAFGDLVRLHASRIYGISFKILKNREDAEDNVQNVLCKAYRKIRLFHGHSRISTWLFRIAVNEALMKLRQRRLAHEGGYSEVAAADDEQHGLMQIADVRADPERQCIIRDLTGKALRSLDPVLRTVFLLQKGEGWTHREVAKVLATSTETAKSRVFRARTRLRQRILGSSRITVGALPA